MGVLFDGWLLLGRLWPSPFAGECLLALEIRGQRASSRGEDPRDAVSGRLDRLDVSRLGGLVDLVLAPGETRRLPLGRGTRGLGVVLEARLGPP